MTTDDQQLHAWGDPMAELPAVTPADLAAACEAEGHLMHDGYCLRCPYVEEKSDGS